MLSQEYNLFQTDDRGVFDTTLSREYALAAESFELNEKHLYDLSLQALESAFISDRQKEELRVHWEKFARDRHIC